MTLSGGGEDAFWGFVSACSLMIGAEVAFLFHLGRYLFPNRWVPR